MIKPYDVENHADLLEIDLESNNDDLYDVPQYTMEYLLAKGLNIKH